jgi:hypothetical protein
VVVNSLLLQDRAQASSGAGKQVRAHQQALVEADYKSTVRSLLLSGHLNHVIALWVTAPTMKVLQSIM